MVPCFAIPIAIIVSCFCASLSAQWPENPSPPSDTLGIYFSSRGFHFDPFYQKAILTTASEPLAGKAAFLLGLADSLEAFLTEAGFPTLNLHRHPHYAPHLEGTAPLPAHWKGLLYVQSLQLHATPQRAVYARSNRLRSEKYHRLEFTVSALYRDQERTKTIGFGGDLPSEGWRQAFLEALRQELMQLAAHN